MLKKIITLSCSLCILLTFAACGEKKILHCDYCGAEGAVDADSNMEEDWIIYCGPCNEELFGDDPILGTGE